MFATSYGDTRQSASETGGGTVPTSMTAIAPPRRSGTRVPSTAHATTVAGDEVTVRTGLCMAVGDRTARTGGGRPAAATSWRPPGPRAVRPACGLTLSA